MHRFRKEYSSFSQPQRVHHLLRFWIRTSLFSCLGLSFLIAFGMRFLNEDLFVALCSGRTTMAGLLAKPDQWSFTMPGKIWVDQSWLTHLVYYLSYLELHDLGPVLLKALLLILCMVVLYFRCRSLGAGLESSLAALVLGTLALAPFLEIRAENFGLLYFLVFAASLCAPEAWGRWRQVACLAILALWCNSHGSFMLGFALLGLRLLVELLFGSKLLNYLTSARIFQSVKNLPASFAESGRESDVRGWLTTWLLAIGVVAFLNPYGLANLTMPFHQLSASRMTSQSVDWIPLLKWDQFWRHGLLQPLDVKPFLFLLAFSAALVATGLTFRGVRQNLVGQFTSKPLPTVLMEILILSMLLIMVFRFRRMILFAAPAIVPCVALLIQMHLDALEKSLQGKSDLDRARTFQFVEAGLVTVCLLFLGDQFLTKTVIPYMPSNPMRYDRPVIGQLMSFDAYDMGAAQFMRDNGMRGRVLSSWTAAAFLLFTDPEVKVFMDARDQSFYSDRVIASYFSIMHCTPQDTPVTLMTLDSHRVSYVLLATNAADFTLATRLMETRRWACIYKDEEFILLARPDSERFGPLFRSSSLKGLHYRSEDKRLVSEAVMCQFFSGRMPHELLIRMENYVRRKPDPDLYSLITFVLNGKSPCLSSEARSFLTSELRHLTEMDYMVPAGATTIVRSMMLVAGLLERDDIGCHSGHKALTCARLRQRATEIQAELESEYRGY